jgi:hypothetical protein
VEIVDLLRTEYDTTVYNFRYVKWNLSNSFSDSGYSLKTLKRRRIKWGLLSTRQQDHGPDDIRPFIAEIRERFPNRGQESIRKTLMLEYKMHVSR